MVTARKTLPNELCHAICWSLLNLIAVSGNSTSAVSLQYFDFVIAYFKEPRTVLWRLYLETPSILLVRPGHNISFQRERMQLQVLNFDVSSLKFSLQETVTCSQNVVSTTPPLFKQASLSLNSRNSISCSLVHE